MTKCEYCGQNWSDSVYVIHINICPEKNKSVEPVTPTELPRPTEEVAAVPTEETKVESVEPVTERKMGRRNK